MSRRLDGFGERRRWSLAAWTVAALLLLLPALAMQVNDEVVWGREDFVSAGALLLAVGVTFELVVARTRSRAYRAAVAVALAAAFILVWANAAVGIIGSEDEPANRMFSGVLAVGIGGAVLARFRAEGMARALVTTALVQGAVAAVAVIAGWGAAASGPLEVLALNGVFVALWLLSAWLFRKASIGTAPSAGV